MECNAPSWGENYIRNKAFRIISKLRSDGPVSKNDLLKNFHIRKEERDALLQQLTEENLLRVDGKQVVATTYDEFMKGLYAREDLPPVEKTTGRSHIGGGDFRKHFVACPRGSSQVASNVCDRLGSRSVENFRKETSL